MVKKCQEIGFVQSLVEECLFYCGEVIFIVYIDDGMFIGNSDDMLTQIIQQMKEKGLNIEDRGRPADYVGVNIKKLCDDTYKFIQCAFIDAIIDEATPTPRLCS